MLPDQQARETAVSLADSFIVQAPAGSGKTELLTRRFLRLLTTVQEPEQVIALTFTRKAASEMRARILSTLTSATNLVEKVAPHQQVLRQDALFILDRDKALGWQLLDNPHRLKVMTIDALCQGLVRSLPMETLDASQADIELLPEKSYRRAAWNCFYQGLEDSKLHIYLLTLLRHLDNRQDRLIELWIDLLRIRDQWLPILYQASSQSKQEVETALLYLQQHAIERLLKSIPPSLAESLRSFCVSFAHLVDSFSGLQAWEQLDTLTLPQAKLLAELILTSDHQIRKRVDHHVGFKRDSCSKEHYQQFKLESERLFEELRLISEVRERLSVILRIPAPHYEAGKWEVLQSLLNLLPLLVAHLKLVFQSAATVDFTEMTLAAISALGEDTSPTDLALYLDYSIQHLLIDEFQDTSITQFRLIQRLTTGWQQGDGRTLFIVGDPMQSIYRFRQAEVGLFLKVKEEGIGTIALKTLALTANFRSTSRLVNWINQRAVNFFPKQNEIELGAVSFHPAVAVLDDESEASFVEATDFNTGIEEATYITQVVLKELARNETHTIAILVRSRAQLEWMIPVLQANQVKFEGVDLFSMDGVTSLCDLWSLTQALLMPHERLPWLAVLRGPYVGLTLEDLLVLAKQVDRGPLYLNFDQIDVAVLSHDGAQRFSRAKQVLQQAYALQDQYVLSDWVLRIHQQLLGHADSSQQWHLMEAFFKLMDQMTDHNRIADWDLFKRAFHKLYASEEASCRVKVMTIHQAKGLEFDTVILSGLSRQVRRGDATLLKWLQIIQSNGSSPIWLLSPLKAAVDEADHLYEYLNFLESQKEAYELQRLLYVALTRAKKRIYLTDFTAKQSRSSFRSLLEISSSSGELFTPLQLQASNSVNPLGAQESLLNRRLKLSTYCQEIPNHLMLGQDRMSLPIVSSASTVGTLIHRWVQWICENQITHENDIPWQVIAREVKQAGILGEEAVLALEKLQHQLKRLLTCAIGQWIIYPHEQACCEFSYQVRDTHEMKTYRVDRMFYAAPYFWIIDFKTGLEPDSLEEHQKQVEQYARHLQPLLASPIQVGVYYLATGKWQTFL